VSYFIQIEHRSPNGDPLAAVSLKHPEVATFGKFAGLSALIEHPKTKSSNRYIACNLNLVIRFLVLQDPGVRTEFSKTCEKSIATREKPGETRESHGDIGMQELSHCRGLSAPPGLIDDLKCPENIVFGCIHSDSTIAEILPNIPAGSEAD
jgi:hypothetical protein